MGQFVIVAYRPRKGKEADLTALVREHVPILRSQGLATDRPAVAMRAADGTIVEVFEWTSAQAIEQAHTNEVVKAMWVKFDAACEYEMLANLPECKRPFSPFEPLEL